MTDLPDRTMRRRAVLVLAIILTFAALAASGLNRTSLAFDYRIYFASDHPALLATEETEALFGRDATVVMVVEAPAGTVLTRERLALIADLTERFWTLPGILRVQSITNHVQTRAEPDDVLSVAPLFPDPANMSDAALAQSRRDALESPDLVGRLLGADGSATLVVGQFTEISGHADGVSRVTSAARTLLEQMREAHEGVRLHLTGSIVTDQTLADAAQRDLVTLIPLSFALITGLIWAILGDWRCAALTMSVVSLSILSAVGLWAWMGGAINPVIASAPSIIATIAVADCIHLLTAFRAARRDGATPAAAVTESVRITARPILITTVTTFIGFLCLTVSPSPPFQGLGAVVAMGVLLSMLFALTILPAGLILLSSATPSDRARMSERMRGLAETVLRRRGMILAVSACLSVLLVAGISQNQFSENYVTFFDERFENRRANDVIDARITGLHRIQFALDTGAEGGLNDPAALSRISAFAKWMRTQPAVVHVHALDTLMVRLNRLLHDDDPDFETLPASREEAAQYLLLYEMSLPYGADIANLVDPLWQRTRVLVHLRVDESDDVLRFTRAAERWLETNGAPLAPARGTGLSVMFSRVAEENIPAMIFGTLATLIGISALMGAVLGSARLGVIALVSSVLPILATFGIWGFVNGRVGLGESIVAGVTLGLVVDDTVHFLTAYRRARAKGVSPEDAVRVSFGTVGVALVTTTIVLAIGFTVLAFSPYRSTANLGALAASTISVALLVDLFLVPPLLVWLERRRSPSA